MHSIWLLRYTDSILALWQREWGCDMGGNISRVWQILVLAGSLGMLPVCQAQDTWEVDMNWATVPGGEWDGATTWIAADGEGQVLVMVRTAPFFRLFDREGNFLRSWGDNDEYGNAHSVTYDAAGNVWATDSVRHVAYKYNPAGAIVFTLGTPGEAGDNQSRNLFNQPNHVFIAANGDLFVSDGYANSRVVQFDSEGNYLRQFGGIKGSGDGELDTPHGVAVDSRGRVLVNDSGNQRVSVFDAAGNFLESWPVRSRGGIIVDADDTVYVSDVNAGAVNILQDGRVVDTIPVDGRPHGLGRDSNGTLFVTDALGRKVFEITRH